MSPDPIQGDANMGEWTDFQQWKDCTRLERPGMVFEVINADGQSLLTPCVEKLNLPWDWKSAPVRFRVVAAPKPRHSTPIPPPSAKSR